VYQTVYKEVKMSFESYLNMKLNDTQWIEDLFIRYNLSETQPRVAKHYIRTQAYWEWRKQI